MNSEITHHTAVVNGVRLHYVIAGTGDPLVLLHGWPQSWYEWRELIPILADRYTVIAPDLRGFGDSEKPAGGYDKRTVAEDIRQLVDYLGFQTIDLVGHDIGMMVAYEYAAAHPESVRRLVVAEAGLPGLGLEVLQDTAKFPEYWHFGFFAAPGVPEALIVGREHSFLSYFVRQMAYDPYAITNDDLDEYARRMAAPGALRSGFEHYRAFPLDACNNQENARKKLPMPVLAIGGDHSMAEQVAQLMQPLADNVQACVIEGCGHWVPEEQPQRLADSLIQFFSTTVEESVSLTTRGES
ncbi:alpha/beta hydrolase [Halomonas sp. DP8Y7-1]|uniref:alpha/beta fold hydrolase n=1 Tax=Halomonas sp. DP8Y7-1 TaxID=2859078 RepID=UPI001C97D303|nr:alpha/beta hydrolase [Halomonas sp. DP8Y7-1]MBY6028123.1 alpha/beta hydrolase [Halomonas sp. DP8Y7-1]